MIWIAPDAPAKPDLGAPCNGCGVCCLTEPCPVGMVLSRRRHGACRALQWHAETTRYRCGLLAEPKTWVPLLPAAWTRTLAARWIAAGQGCDAAVTVQAVEESQQHPPPMASKSD